MIRGGCGPHRRLTERQREGIEQAKVKGVYVGGKRRLDRTRILQMSASGMPVAQIAAALGCSRMQVYRILSGVTDSGPQNVG